MSLDMHNPRHWTQRLSSGHQRVSPPVWAGPRPGQAGPAPATHRRYLTALARHRRKQLPRGYYLRRLPQFREVNLLRPCITARVWSLAVASHHQRRQCGQRKPTRHTPCTDVGCF